MVEIIKAKYAGPRFSVLSALGEQVINQAAEVCLFKICVITGWQLPDSPNFQTALEGEFAKYCAEKLSDLTPEEIAFAMRNYALEVKDWGKYVNLQLINEPINAYRSARAEASRFEEQKRTVTQEIEGPKDTDWSDTWEKLIKGEITGIYADLVPYPSIYDWVVKTGLYAPTNGIKWGWINKARIEFIKEVDLKRETFRATHDEKELSEMMKVPTWDKNERVASALIASAKTIAVKEWIEKEKPSQ